ncbi:DUF6377 domain-containing protein [uncultured Bacteroides sp.]|uniref:DUF6377 domain-containing protein n=1 Tax=uncultured Bacteroides sp. TaxID=162156 RepID=UPI0025FE7C76|nr:DUF6377 domain-containing protein [uncultured Bacteroides sp.]
MLDSIKYSKYFIFLFFFIETLAVKAEVLDSLLKELDKTIETADIYVQHREVRICQLKEMLKSNRISIEERFKLNTQLYQEYKAYVCDSAMQYLSININLAESSGDKFRKDQNMLHLSLLLSSLGMYTEAIDVLSSVDRNTISNDLLIDYYSCINSIYGELGIYTKDKKLSNRYWIIAQNYKDSLSIVLPKESDEYLFIRETVCCDRHDYDEALKINDYRLSMVNPETPQYALVAYHRSLIYKYNSNRTKEKEYLCRSAISDVQSAIKDHASLWMLAKLLYDDGDYERAYRYMRFSWDATKFYNARLRSWQSADVLSLIDKTYQMMIEKQNNRLQQYLMFITFLLVLLSVSMVYIYSQMKKLSKARNSLQTVNSRLNELNSELKQMNECLSNTNIQLSEANHIKEEYIARFIKLCSTYIDRLDAYRRMVNKKINGGHVEDLLKITKSQNLIDEELKDLYDNFDSAFLHLFPNFISKFNELLLDTEKIYPKKDELLNTELRIFALIRLGIDDSSQIAEFLRYSVNTIYNYRAKVKNKSHCQRDKFEQYVKEIH